MSLNVLCSNCGAVDDLYFVTYGEPGGDFPGRTLVYCSACRKANNHRIDVSLPLGLMTPAIFIGLYQTGRTESHPETAVEIVFGEQLPAVVEAAYNAMSARSSNHSRRISAPSPSISRSAKSN